LGGNVLKFPFGTLTQLDAKKYMQHIQKLEDEQQSFLRILQEQMFVLNSAIMSFNITMQKVDRNERILNENLHSLNKMVVDEINQMHMQIDSVKMINENFQQIQRGIEECQHAFEILVDAFLHACSRGSSSTTVDYHSQDKRHDEERISARWTRLSIFPFLRTLQTYIIFSQNSYLVYILQMHLLQSTPYQLHKLQPFPVEQQEKVFVYFEITK